MIAYFETSALVPILISEPTTPLCNEIWHNADGAVTSLITYAETAAALAKAEQMGRISESHHRLALRGLDSVFDELRTLNVDEDTIHLAADLANTYSLRGYDAVQCATAAGISSTSMVAITGDRALADAWRNLGVYTIDTTEITQQQNLGV